VQITYIRGSIAIASTVPQFSFNEKGIVNELSLLAVSISSCFPGWF